MTRFCRRRHKRMPPDRHSYEAISTRPWCQRADCADARPRGHWPPVRTRVIGLIITTNFDRLIERGLEQAGISPQVISRPSAVVGMTPLVHAPATIVKLHGDYTMLGLRNTTAELSTYPRTWPRLLAQVFAEYGLLVIGWSANWDFALVRELERSGSLRYPMFWGAHHGRLGDVARRLVAQHGATVIDLAGADESFSDLGDRIDRPSRIASRRARPHRQSVTYLHPDSQPLRGWSTAPLLACGPRSRPDRAAIGRRCPKSCWWSRS
jgi:hypothetical protein